ncbi:TetR/AcrR family transcriptional regulator [Accumulibacter sp.]|uniref:TetR/AcrR family transcriptional regulator n=1 Tax=Accumulibacter sp. TaxID=2053492 RepID=UPI001AD270F1|nr:TetR/AcrR family transcriptional regulator [Accumulibacter sp.]MBN8453756.1 TetR/AcrR family transcriptional regulator [Accumulibacter sp.]
MVTRSELKEASLLRILTAGAARLRAEGLAGAAIVPVMHEAGLTHGAFYAHFSNKEELAAAAFRFALLDNRPRWIGPVGREPWRSRLVRLGKRYLTTAHRDQLADSCALAALASDAGRSNAAFKKVYEEELHKSLRAICLRPDEDSPIDPARLDDAMAFMALSVGGITLARAVDDPDLSERILAVCRQAVERLAVPGNEPSTNPEEPDHAGC